MADILKNYILLSAVVSWFAAQLFKVIMGMIHHKKFRMIKLFVSSGGMPSSHSASVSALCTASGFEYGIASFQFAVTFILAMIVMHDAAGVRNQVGKQAKVINKIKEGNVIECFENINLKELVGHTPLQVCVGSILGIAVAFCFGQLY